MKIISLTTLTFTLAVTALSSGAFAGELSYADFVKSCQNPGAYGHQRPPESIKIQCKNVLKGWEPIEAGSTALTESRCLSAEVFSDKSHVALENFTVAVPELNVACPRFRQVVETSQIEKALTCAQVIAETRTLKEICIDAIDEAIAENPDIVTTVPTGAIYNSCSGSTQKP